VLINNDILQKLFFPVPSKVATVAALLTTEQIAVLRNKTGMKTIAVRKDFEANHPKEAKTGFNRL